jgi:hypothetical protein
MGLAIVGMDFMVHIVNINNALKIAIKEEIAQGNIKFKSC